MNNELENERENIKKKSSIENALQSSERAINLNVDSYMNAASLILKDKVKDIKDKEEQEMNEIKEEYEVKIKAFREKYKQLEEKELLFLENEFNLQKERLEKEYNEKIKNYEFNLRKMKAKLQFEEEDLAKRFDIIAEKRKQVEVEWTTLKNEDDKLDNFKNHKTSTLVDVHNSNDFQLDENQSEIVRLRIEKRDLELKLNNMKNIIEKFFENPVDKEEFLQKNAEIFNQSDNLLEKLRKDLINEDNDGNEDDLNELIKHAKAKLELKLSHVENNISSSDDDSVIQKNKNSYGRPSDTNKVQFECFLVKEKDSLQVSKDLVEKYKVDLMQLKAKLVASQHELERKQNVEDDKLMLEKEKIEIEKIELELKRSKRIIKKKELQLNLLENSLDKGALRDEDYLSDIIRFDSEFISDESSDESIDFQDNSSFFFNLNDDLKEVNYPNQRLITKMLKHYSKLSSKLKVSLEIVEKALNSLKNSKPKIILKTQALELQETFTKSLNSPNYQQKTIIPHDIKFNTYSWENSPHYSKLAFKNNVEKLNNKWATYVGNSVRSSNDFNSAKLSQEKLPTGTIRRLEEHREWLKKFRADLTCGITVN